MGNSPTIGQGPGNLVPDSKVMRFLAAEAISKGECVCLTTAQGSASYSVSLADQATGLYHVIGVAKEDIASGDWGTIVVGGYCAYVIGDAAITAGDYIGPSTTPGTSDTIVIGTATWDAFGVALSDDTATIFDALIFNRIG